MERDGCAPGSTRPVTLVHYALTAATVVFVVAFLLLAPRTNTSWPDVGSDFIPNPLSAFAVSMAEPNPASNCDCGSSRPDVSWAAAGGAAAASAGGGPLPSLNSYFLHMPPSEPIPDTCMAELLHKAEETYQRNMARRGNLSFGSTVSRADLLNHILVPPYPCVLEQRVGKGGEGGKYVCRGYMGAARVEAQGPSVVSIGSHGQTSFEEDVNALLGGAVTLTLDPFLEDFDVEDLQHKPYLRFEKKGLLGKAEQQEMKQQQKWGWERMVTVDQLTSMAGKQTVDIFKMDCEGCEYGVLKDLEDLAKVNRTLVQQPLLGQVAIEVHNAESKFAESLLPLLARFESMGFRLFHAEENAYWRWEGFELAYIHKSLVQPPTKAGALSGEESKACADLLSKRAATIYEANWRRKGWRYEQREPPSNMEPRSLLSVMLVSDFPCAQQERFGSWGTGGIWVCLTYRESCSVPQQVTVLTIAGQSMTQEGAQQNLGFSKDLISHLGGVAHLMAPPTLLLLDAVQAEAEAGTVVVHNSTALLQREHPASTLFTSIMSAVDNTRVFLLRIDCGGCEYDLINDMAETFNSRTAPFRQIALSLHNWEKSMPLLMKLHSLGYRQFHAEGRGDDESVFELAFVHERCT